MLIDKLNKKFKSIDLFLFIKDFGDIWKFSSNKLILPLIALFLGVIVPLVFLLLPSLVLGESVNALSNLVPKSLEFDAPQKMHYIMVTMIYPMVFILIPVLSSAGTTATLFVGERNAGTMEILLRSKCSLRMILKTKLCSAVLSASIPTFFSAVSFMIIISVSNMIYGMPMELIIFWVILLFFCAPTLVILTALLTYRFSRISKRVLDAVLPCSYIVLPFLILIMGQYVGFYQINWYVLLSLEIAIVIINLIVYNKCMSKVNFDKLNKYIGGKINE